MFDLSSFGKFRLEGRDAEAELQRLCCNDVAVAPGRCVYTGMLNARGGYEADLTATRLGPNLYFIVTSAASQSRDFRWIQRNLRPDANAVLTDVTSAFATLAVMGPSLARRAAVAHLDTARQCRVPLRHLPGDRDRLRARAGDAHDLRRRAGLGAPRAERERRSGVRPADGGGARSRARARRLPRPRHPAQREGLPIVGPRHHAGGDAARGRPRLHRRLRQGGRLQRARRARAAARARRREPPALLQARGPRPDADSRRADPPRRRDRRAHHLGRVRPHARRLGRHGLRHASAAKRSVGRSRSTRRAGASRSRSPPTASRPTASARPFYDPSGARLRL